MKKIYTFAMIQTVWIFVLVMSCFIYGCGEDGWAEEEEDRGPYYYPETQNILFHGTWKLTLEITPNVAQPSFAWKTTGLKYVTITIFSSKIDLKDNRIVNSDDAVWSWNTGLGKGREGNVSFSDGRDMRYGEIQDTVSPLSPGVYYIAAWAYDEGYNLDRSSEEYQYRYYPKQP